jgi:CBS domain-containing protein
MTRVSDVMTRNPIICESSTTIVEAAQLMRDRDIGDVLVSSGDEVIGIATDRDLVVRGLAGGIDLAGSVTLGDVCTSDLAFIDAGATVDEAAQMMSELAVRRLPVIDGDEPVGIVSLGDLAVSEDPHSTLADISASEPTQ